MMNTTSVAHSDCPEVKIPASLFTTIGLISLAENFLVVLAVIRNRNLHSPMYCFICSLAAFNTIASVTKTCETIMIAIADGGTLEKKGSSETKLDDIIDSLLCMSFVGSISSFLAIAVDRYVCRDWDLLTLFRSVVLKLWYVYHRWYVSFLWWYMEEIRKYCSTLYTSYITIFHALRYHNIVTMRRTRAILAVIWTTCGVSAVLMVRFFDSKFIMICFVIFFVLSLAIICFLYAFMFMLARIHARKIAALPTTAGLKCRWRGRSMRGALTLTILVGTFMVCWAPFFLHLIIIMVCPTNPYCECYRSLFQLHMVLMMCHALIDPAIYAFRSAELRQTFRRMLLCSYWMQCS